MRIASILLLLGMPFGSLWACSCIGAGSPCQAAGRAAAVFTGTALAIADETAPPVSSSGTGMGAASRRQNGEPVRVSFPVRNVRMRVGDVLSGVPPGQTEIEIVTGYGGGDCGYAFQAGMDYVVYAHLDAQGRLATSICSRTRPLDQAEEDVAYFRAMAPAPAASELRVRTGLGDTRGEPGVTIRADGPAGAYSAQTDAAGVATFLRLQPGEYSIHQQSDGDLPGDPKVQVYAKGCVDVTLLRTLELVGRVTTDDGRPAARIEVEVRSSRGLEASAMTNADGRYQLKVSRPGQYQLGVNLTHTATRETPYPRWFYPGTEDPLAAAAIEFLGRPDTRAYDVVLPERLREREVEGFVWMADGRPAPAARLFALDSSLATTAHEIAGPDGHFRLRVFAGVPYELHAVWPEDTPAGATSAVPTEISAGNGSLTLKLILDQAGNSFADASGRRSLTRQ
ncbi:MAG: carboxypeptidase-like regulatory domain-containing protein [Bryobacterales bacterium]|jgi:hypothetical protein|nr:carboxypeptidase-like regulatory domain-containing protein [Bryobacterales bacterium]